MTETMPSLTKAIHCNPRQQTFHRITSLDQLDETNGGLFWLDLISPSEQDLDRLATRFTLHPLAIEDATHGHQRPKIEEYEDFFFVVFYAVSPPEGKATLIAHELRMFVGHNYLITVHDVPLPELDEAERRWTRATAHLEWGIGVLVYALLDTIVDNYFPIADALVDQADDLGELIYKGRQTAEFTLRLLALRRCFMGFRRLVGPERDVVNTLTNRDSPIFVENTLVYFRDVADHVSRLADTLDLYRDQLSSTMDANIALSSNDLNRVMRTLTAASIILMTGALIAGIYGMNFDIMPELHWRFGYVYALLLIAISSGALWLYFRHLRWL